MNSAIYENIGHITLDLFQPDFCLRIVAILERAYVRAIYFNKSNSAIK